MVTGLVEDQGWCVYYGAGGGGGAGEEGVGRARHTVPIRHGPLARGTRVRVLGNRGGGRRDRGAAP